MRIARIETGNTLKEQLEKIKEELAEFEEEIEKGSLYGTMTEGIDVITSVFNGLFILDPNGNLIRHYIGLVNAKLEKGGTHKNHKIGGWVKL